MIKDIKYSGISTAPSDYESPDGALCESLNLISEDQHLMPLFQPKEIIKLDDYHEEEVVYYHKTSAFNHYIIYGRKSGYLHWANKDGVKNLIQTGNMSKDILEVTSVGNTLVIVTSNGMWYYMWKGNDYINLGNHIPTCGISFGLLGKSHLYSAKNGGKFQISFDKVSNLSDELSESNQKKVSDQVLAKVNKFITDVSTEQGEFLYPFFIRYALRLYDGSLVNHSAPILMTPSTGPSPLTVALYNGGKDGASVDLFAMTASIDYSFDIQHAENWELEDWKDIIKSVDVFISAPIYTYDQSGLIKNLTAGYGRSGTIYSRFSGKYMGGDGENNNNVGLGRYYQDTDLWLLYDVLTKQCSAHPDTNIRYMGLPRFSDEVLNKKIQQSSIFYYAASIGVEDFTGFSREKLKVSSHILKNLLSQEVMTDDYQTHDKLVPKNIFAYNARLNMSNIERTPFKGFAVSSMVQHTDGFRKYVPRPDYTAYNFDDYNQLVKYNTTVVLNSDHGVKVLHNPDEKGMLQCRIIKYLYYTDNGASEMFLSNGDTFNHKVKLKKHEMLNGAFYFNGLNGYLDSSTDIQKTDIPEPSSETVILLSNKLYTSEVNNPFYFPLTGINTVGTGTILGISSATKALSQGQFGQFPLYAFTDEGVWAMEVTATGTYSAKQPVTRDVCINSGSITQLDNAVLFATARGIMLLSGSQTFCITENIDSPAPFNALSLQGMAELHKLAGHSDDTCFPTQPFLTFLQDCSMVFDYVHQHIIVFNKAYTYAYVYSLKSKEWGMIHSSLASKVNSYPEAWAMTSDHRLVSFSETDEEVSTGIYLTRPIKLETPDVMKTIDTCIQRGMFNKGDVQTAMWGSRDLQSWHLIGSSVDNFLRGVRGTPFKYFRIAGITKFKPDMSLFGASLQFTPKFTNKPR